MSLLHAILLGIIQGLTEFFPVSSSAHLKLLKMIFGLGETSILFDLSCHLGTLFALLWFFKKEIWDLFSKARFQLVYFSLALLPLIPSYFLLGPLRTFASQPQFLGFFLMITGAILFLGHKIRIQANNRPVRDALFIGTFQSFALFPGISRSASTISCAKSLGWETKDAVRFSFLLAIPTIMGGNLLEIQKLYKEGQMSQLLHLHSVVSFITSFLVGMWIIRAAIRFLERGNLKVFAWYCVGLGMIVSIYMYGFA